MKELAIIISIADITHDNMGIERKIALTRTHALAWLDRYTKELNGEVECIIDGCMYYMYSAEYNTTWEITFIDHELV